MIFKGKDPVRITEVRDVYLPNFGFGLVSKSNVAVVDVSGCRDFISDSMRAAANGRSAQGAGYHTHEPPNFAIDFDRLRLLVVVRRFKSTDEKVDRLFRMDRAVNVLNLYEELAGWEDRTEIYPVEVGKNRPRDNFFLLKGPGEWMRASQAVSMVTLLIRFFARTCGENHIPRFGSVDEVQRWLEIIESDEKSKPGGSSVDRAEYMKKSYKLFPHIMERYDELFPPGAQEMLFPNEHDSWHSRGGVFFMCHHNTQIDHVDETIRDIKRTLSAKEDKP